MTTEGLRELVHSKYKSIHALCRAHSELSRSTVYQVLSGRYIGNAEAQAVKIRAAVEGCQADIPCLAPPRIEREKLADTLQGIRCGNCRRLDKRGCAECRTQTAKEAFALHRYFFE